MSRMPKSQAFDVTDAQLRKSEFKDKDGLCRWLCNELDNALSARSGVESEIKYAWAIYQQDRTRGRNTPWPDAADLTSPYGAEYVDALHARIMANTFTDTVWMVEGWGESAVKAPFVEEFHQRAQEDSRYQGYEDERVLRALIEGVGTLEITENVEMRRQQDRKRVKLRLSEGAPVLGEDNEPELEQDEQGAYVEAKGEEPSAEVDIDSEEPVRIGPSFDVIPFLDFLTLPNHAKSKDEVWGYAKRFWRRVPQLAARAKSGMYDKKAVEELGTDNERNTTAEDAPTSAVVPAQDGPIAQKELWEVQFLADCDGRGERWYRGTVSRDRTKLLRLKVDDRTTRYNQFIPFPKPGSAGRGYSLITNKMITVIEEDTAIRNLRADRAAFKASQPILRLHNALWDPYEQPMGPGRVLDVRSKDEISVLQGIEDVSQGVMLWKQDVRVDGDRLFGGNDVSLGQETEDQRTLGEVQLRASYSEVRINVVLKRHAETVEEVGQACHTIWKRTLRERENLPPMRATRIGKMADGIEVSGLGADGTVSADLLEGIYWFKPKGSVETSDLMRVRSDFVGFLQALGPLMQVNPQLGMLLRTIPAAKSIMKQAMRVFRWPDRQSIIGPEGHGVFEQMEMQQQVQQAMQDPRMRVLLGLMGAGDGAQPQLPGGGAPGGGAMAQGQPADPMAPQAQGPVM